ncbi:hypothetical protein FACS18949_01890 [Clostridia bacterium]|nr:hypothetical protein FACS18949_01890 [Clostridia bacterium]
MRAYLKSKQIDLNRQTITLLDNPPYLAFMFDEPNERLIVLPAFAEAFETYEISKHYWKNKRQTCRICRLPFFLTLQQKFNWKDNRIHIVQGVFQVFEGNKKLVVFNFADTIEVDTNK